MSFRPGGERWAVALALVVALGAWIGTNGSPVPSVSLGTAMVGAGAALAVRRPGLVCLAGGLLAVCLAQRSMAGLDVAPPTGSVQAELTLLTDPAPTSAASVRAEVGLDGRRLSLIAHRSAAAALDQRLAGERVTVRGRVLAPGRYELRMRHRHLVGRLEADTVMGWRPGHGVTRAANGLRRTLADGAASLPQRQQSLLMGLTLGDDRSQPVDLTEAFRAAGLGHLTAVSGQNVAFLLAVTAPLLMRVRFAPRLVLTLGVLAGFALITRGEPSVLRATAMAAVSAFGAATGRPSSSIRTLGLAVAGLLLCDPLLVSSLGFQLSVVGAGGIILGASPIERQLPGPRWLANPLAMTCAAQLAVAPLLVATFGPLSLASLPANVLAVPAAGPVMVWGLTGGLVAGLVGELLAMALHAPTRLLLAWIETVALAAERWPLGAVGGWQVGVLLLAVLLGVGARSLPWPAAGRVVRWIGVVGALGVLIAAVVPDHGAVEPSGPVALGSGMVLWRGGGATALEIDGRASESGLWAGLRQAGVRRVDLLVLRTEATRAIAVAARARERWPSVVVLALPGVVGLLPDAVAPPSGAVIELGRLRLRVDAASDRVTLSAVRDDATAAPRIRPEDGRLRT
jgi:competence protein ComEC